MNWDATTTKLDLALHDNILKNTTPVHEFCRKTEDKMGDLTNGQTSPPGMKWISLERPHQRAIGVWGMVMLSKVGSNFI